MMNDYIKLIILFVFFGLFAYLKADLDSWVVWRKNNQKEFLVIQPSHYWLTSKTWFLLVFNFDVL